ncbi:MAG: hypothetical protein K0S48_3038, partial [Ramlibacter sp.]|nr:hypothetical protein [Ramlibacter sp.]
QRQRGRQRRRQHLPVGADHRPAGQAERDQPGAGGRGAAKTIRGLPPAVRRARPAGTAARQDGRHPALRLRHQHREPVGPPGSPAAAPAGATAVAGPRAGDDRGARAPRDDPPQGDPPEPQHRQRGSDLRRGAGHQHGGRAAAGGQATGTILPLPGRRPGAAAGRRRLPQRHGGDELAVLRGARQAAHRQGGDRGTLPTMPRNP